MVLTLDFREAFLELWIMGVEVVLRTLGFNWCSGYNSTILDIEEGDLLSIRGKSPQVAPRDVMVVFEF
jgi:hypothetical protein